MTDDLTEDSKRLASCRIARCSTARRRS